MGSGGTVCERRSGHWDGVVTGVTDQHTRIAKRKGAGYFEGKPKSMVLVSL